MGNASGGWGDGKARRWLVDEFLKERRVDGRNDLLPVQYSSEEYGRFTRGAAKVLLSRLHQCCTFQQKAQVQRGELHSYRQLGRQQYISYRH